MRTASFVRPAGNSPRHPSWASRVVPWIACAFALAGVLRGQSATPTFREGVDVIPVDVQVVDKTGQPITGLTADRFDVTINGRRRKVVSADLVDYRAPGLATTRANAAPEAGLAPPTAPTTSPPGRIFVLAVDANSFDPAQASPVLEAAADFIRKLGPGDEVGLFAYPGGPVVNPTTDHDAVIRTLDKVVVRLDAPPAGEFALGANDLLDLAKFDISLGQSPEARSLVERFCPPGPPDMPNEDFPSCVGRLQNEVRGQLLIYESTAQITAANLQDLMAALGQSPRRKTLLLVSGGLLSSNDPGGRPDNRQMGSAIGRAAAQANVSVYALFVDRGRTRVMSAANGRMPSSFNAGLESNLQSRWLDDVAGTAGGSMLRIAAGNGEPAFAQVLRETSAFYLLGVEPDAQDRDGRTHELRVKVRGSSASVRGRSWVFLPKAGTPPPDLVGRTSAPAQPTRAEEPPASHLSPPPPAVTTLADAFLRNDVPTITRALAARDASALFDAFRTSASPWPAAPRRTAIFALDLATEGLRSSSPVTQREALRLLAEYMVRVRQADGNRAFECTWLWTASAMLEGLFQPQFSTVLVDRAAARCPDDANLRLARAVVRDQELLAGGSGRDPAAPPSETIPEPEARVLNLYRLAAERTEAREEATIRGAYLHVRAGRAAQGLALLDSEPASPVDGELVYVHALVRGQLLAMLGRPDEAAEALHAARVALPAAPAAMVSSMTTAVIRGEHAEAADLAERVLAADRTFLDPWWLFALGDYRAYDAIRARLRSLGE